MNKKHPDFQVHFNNGLFAFFLVLFFFFVFSLPAGEAGKTLLSLADCVDAALKNNPLIRASRFSVEESRTGVDAARSGYWPSIVFNAGGRSSSLESSSNTGGTLNQDHYSGGLSFQYPVFQGGKTISTVRAAKAGLVAEQARHRMNEEELVINVISAYYRLLQAERLMDSARQSMRRAEMHLDFAQTLFETGLATRSDILKAQVAQADMTLSLIRARNAHLAARGRLNLEMGRSVNEPLAIVDDLEAEGSPDGREVDFSEGQFEIHVEMAFQNRPELVQINERMNAQRANIRLARSDYYPTLSLFGGYGFDGLALSDMNASGHIGLSLSYSVFDGFLRPARVKQEQLALGGLEAQQEGLRRQISLEVWNAYLQVKEAMERVESARVYYASALESRNIAEGEYREGVGSMLDVIDAQTAFVTAEQTQIEALADGNIARAVLNRAVGIRNFEEKAQ
ncbi:MAG TPA: TolC family protein [Candidatus Aminicenantes bacterium]|nr:TolC family protein [Candidatus Aminicenantes bacterium]